MQSLRNMDCDETLECLGTFFRRFFTLIVLVSSMVSCFIYTVGVLRYIRSIGQFKRLEIPHFMALVLAVASTVIYCLLHCSPKKMYRLMYGLSVLLVLSIGMLSHSLGITAPVVDDCDEMSATQLLNSTRAGLHFGNLTSVQTIAVNTGSLGQSLGNCVDNQVIFAGAFMLATFQILALFDVQRMLLERVRTKTYGERFVEMGIR